MKRALIFDCDGVLIDGEQQAQLDAFNQMWREQNISWQWSKEEYKRKLKISGGKERLESLYYDASFRATVALPQSFNEWKTIVKTWHQRKTRIYGEIIGAIQPRSGVRRLAEEAISQNWVVAVASSGAKASVEIVVQHVMGTKLAPYFQIFADDIVSRKKPEPDIYKHIIHATDVSPQNCIVIEDNRNGLLAACAAHMNCIITPTSLTLDENFSEAALVVSSLGDPDGERCTVLQNQSHLQIGEYVSLANLACLCFQDWQNDENQSRRP